MLLIFVACFVALVALGFVIFILVASHADRRFEAGQISNVRRQRITNTTLGAYMAFLGIIVLIAAIFGPEVTR